MRRVLAAARTTTILAALLAPFALSAPARAETVTVPALKQFGEPEFKPGFTHFPHANPEAPKGGQITLAAQGSFDSLSEGQRVSFDEEQSPKGPRAGNVRPE